MDARSSSLIVGVYLLGGVVLAGVVAAALLVFSREARLRQQLAQAAAQAGPPPGRQGAYLSRSALTQQEFLAAQNAAEIERLRALLEEKNRLLEERAAQLKNRTSEYQRLQREFEAAASVLLEGGGRIESRAPSPESGGDRKAENRPAEVPTPGAEPPAAADGEPLPVAPSEVAALREELNKARLLETALVEEVEQLQAEILAADAAIARIQAEAQTQAERLLADERLLREAATETVVRVGEAAVPALVEALRDESPAVRRWAALVLADLGPAGASALGPLMDALNDRDESVRASAAQALRAVTARD